jgi:hypothetical protein
MKSYSFWNITSCSPLKDNGRFGGTYHINPKFELIGQAKTGVK